MVSAVAQALLQRTATVRKLAQTIAGDDPASAKTIALFDERSAQGLDAINKLEAAKIDVKKQAKDLAKQRLARLKEQLRLLRMFGGSAKSVARQAAQLAREIASAVRSYSGSDGATTPVDDSKLAYSGSEAQSDGETAQNPDAGTQDADTGKTADTADTATPTATDESNKAAPTAQSNADREADRAFYQDAKNALAQLKRVIEDAQRKQRQKRGDGGVVVGDALNAVSAAAHTVATIADRALAVPVVVVTTTPVRISV